jgi:YegS/Rv2252/BmrU family lipid kinase
MRAAAILGLGCSPKDLRPFQTNPAIEWQIGMPASGDQVDIVLLFGGDGTVHRHLGQLVKLAAPLLVVPAGSGNDFASSLGLRQTRDSVAVWKKFCTGRPVVRQIDIGSIVSLFDSGATPAADMRYFCCVAGVGIDGEVARRANAMPRWLRGHGGYLLSLFPAIFKFSPVAMRVLTSSNSSDSRWAVLSNKPTLLAAFANTPLYGGGMRVAPRAKMDDGLLDVCIVDSLHPMKLFALFPTVYVGQHLGMREVRYFQAPRARIETEYPLDVYADGEYVCQTPVELSIAKAALKIVTPEQLHGPP